MIIATVLTLLFMRSIKANKGDELPPLDDVKKNAQHAKLALSRRKQKPPIRWLFSAGASPPPYKHNPGSRISSRSDFI